MNIQEMLDKYESFKLKWLQLNEQDMFDWLALQDEMEYKVIELKSKYAEDELQYKKEYWIRLIEVRQMKDSNGKKLLTVDEAKSVCDKEFYDKELEMIVTKASYENLQNKAKKIVEYINVVKLAVRKDFSI